MTRQRPLTQLAHQLIAPHVRADDITIDATAGNGHDSLFLAQQVGPCGQVHAYDIQQQALQATRQRLEGAGCGIQLHLHPDSHAHLLQTLPSDYRGRVAAITFNLGYLPGGDHATTTRIDSTLSALEQSLVLLRPGGVLSVLAYRGHPGGQEEADAVADWCGSRSGLVHEIHESPGPVLHWCIREA